jgi:hypothetical protein
MATRSSVFWNITPCSPIKAKRRFGGTFCFHPQSRRISRARNQHERRWQVILLTETCRFRNVARLSTDYTALYISEDRILRIHRCDNLKSYKSANPCNLTFSIYRLRPLSVSSVSSVSIHHRLRQIHSSQKSVQEIVTDMRSEVFTSLSIKITVF